MKWFTILLAVMVVSLTCGVAQAAPSVKRNNNSFAIVEGVNDEILAQIKAEMGEVDQKKLGFALKTITDADLAKLCAAYPGMDGLTIEASKELTSIAPVAGLKGLRGIKLSGNNKVADFTPLAGLTEMLVLDLAAEEMGPDLKWMSGMTKLTRIGIRAGGNLTSLEGIPSFPTMKEVTINSGNFADLGPLVTALPGLEKVNLQHNTIADLTPLASLANMTKLDLYGAKVKDFSPLAGAAKLRELNYYSTRDSDYSTLGKLTQVENLQGGLTRPPLADISWVANLPNLKTFRMFAEVVKDYSPLSKAKVEHLTIWNMQEPVDLNGLAGAVSLTYLRLWGINKEVSNFGGLAGLVNLKELIIDDVNQKNGTVDLAFAKSLTKVETLTLAGGNFLNTNGLEGLGKLTKLTCSKINKVGDKPFDFGFLAKIPELTSISIEDGNVANLEAIAACEKLRSVTLRKVPGVTSLAALKKLPNLTSLTVSKDAFPEAELSGFGEKVKVSQR